MTLVQAIHKIRDGKDLSSEETKIIFDEIFSGDVEEERIGAFLLALRRKGETVEEILGAAQSMRGKALTISAPDNAMDIVGTGGDSKGTYNISTATALVVASCGVPVAKHGNRAATSKSGSSDVLAALGVNLDAPFPILEKCLRETNLCFLFAPKHHPAMKHVAAIRKKLGVRTIFNLLGPLTNPANVKKHLIGVYSDKFLLPLAEVLHDLGSHSAWITHGRDGMDEITTTAITDVVSLSNDELSRFEIAPQDLDLHIADEKELIGGDAQENAKAINSLLAGEKTAYRKAVIINAAAALVIAGKATDMKHGVSLAGESIDLGQAAETLRKIVKTTNL